MPFDTKDYRETVIKLVERDATTQLREFIHELHYADLAVVLESLPPDIRLQVWLEVAYSQLGDVLAEVSEGVRESLIRQTSPRTLVQSIQNLDIDDIVEMVPDLSSEIVAELMIALDERLRENLDVRLSYDEDSAGRFMDGNTVTVRAKVTVGTVMRYLRLFDELPEHTDKLYVVNRQGVLQGSIQIRKLLTAAVDDLVATHMNENTYTFDPHDPMDDVVLVFQRYDLHSAPVVDASGILLGRITIDDVVDSMEHFAGRTLMANAGLNEEDDIFAPILFTSKRRAIWLGVNLVTAVLASLVIHQFEDEIEKLVALAVLMPIIASMGGNAGTQTLTSVIRGLGVGTISMANALDVLKKEILVGSLNGLVWAAVVSIVSIIWYQNFGLAIIVAIAMFVNIVVSVVSGVSLPVLLTKFGIDPALAAGVALTTVTDVVGFLAILGLAALILL